MEKELRNKVAARMGKRPTSPDDCRALAIEIFESTQKKISETTLKRFFGLVFTKHKFSKYTLATLTEYAENDCTVIINTKINPSEGQIKNDMVVKFDLQDGNLQSGNCISKADLKSLNESPDKDVPIKIKLNKNQVKDLLGTIKKSKK